MFFFRRIHYKIFVVIVIAYVLQVVVSRSNHIEISNAKKTTEISNRFRQDLQEVVVDTSERLSDLISKGVELVDYVRPKWVRKNAYCPY